MSLIMMFEITHRLSTIAGADNIPVAENGKIAEQGHHTECGMRNRE